MGLIHGVSINLYKQLYLLIDVYEVCYQKWTRDNSPHIIHYSLARCGPTKHINGKYLKCI